MSYDRVSDPVEYVKYKRNRRTVILKEDLLPAVCAGCGEPIEKDDGNRASVYPQKDIVVARHYMCAWDNIMNALFRRSGSKDVTDKEGVYSVQDLQ